MERSGTPEKPGFWRFTAKNAPMIFIGNSHSICLKDEKALDTAWGVISVGPFSIEFHHFFQNENCWIFVICP
jgi:hypothetical protein